MKKIFNILYSTRLMAVLFVAFATAMGVATFVENDYGTQTAKAVIYNARWFEAMMVFFVINFFGNIFRYRLVSKEKWPVLVFHLAFICILIGAGITRYLGYEGLMLINEGEVSNTFLSETTYLNLVVDNDKHQKTYHKKTLFSAKGKNTWSLEDQFKGKQFSIDLVDYIPWAEKTFVEDESGSEYLFLVESSRGERHEHYIKKGTLQDIHGVLIGFDAPGRHGSINIFRENDSLKIITKSDGNWMRMADRAQGTISKDSIQPLQLRSLYKVAGIPFVIPQPIIKGRLETVSAGRRDDKKLDVLVLNVQVDDVSERIELAGGKYNTQNSRSLSVNGLNFRMLYGAQFLETPFSIKLNDFQLEKYPGSESAQSYASEVTVIGEEEAFDYRIYMNHILDHKGYKFFQASYDLTGEVEQTHLSVNHDFWGTLITYIGYSLLYFGMISILFAPGTRFDFLKKTLKKIQKKKVVLSIGFGFLAHSFAFGQYHDHKTARDQQIDSILATNIVNLSHAEAFNKIIIQDDGGRMKPAHTYASELIRKVHRKETFREMQPSQVLLSILEDSRLWFDVPFIYLEKGNYQIREQLNLHVDAEYAKLSDFITPEGEYKIREAVSNAQKKNIQNKFEKDLIKIDRRVGLFYRALTKSILSIYPVPYDEDNTWVSPPEVFRTSFPKSDSLFVRQSFPAYMKSLVAAKKDKDYSHSDKYLQELINFQKKYGANVYPDEKKIEAEILYNKFSVFKNLSKYYGLFGVLLILLVIIQIFFHKSNTLKFIIKTHIAIIITLLVIHTVGLIFRWYISGHAPWANAYESMIYVAWATMLFGLILGKESSLTIGAATFIVSVMLLFTHQSYWLDPEIGNLVPVLNSWWVMVHVSIIVASYGPFALGMILGILAMALTIFKTRENKSHLELNVKEITAINEMAITIGLIKLTIGNFLGGMWANESWGRYWGWDPKETWALISIMIYAFVLHMRLIPSLRGVVTFNFMSAFAFLSVMMTYFGVNFYLSGLHSYASGDKQVTPKEALIYCVLIIVLALLAWFKQKKLQRSS